MGSARRALCARSGRRLRVHLGADALVAAGLDETADACEAALSAIPALPTVGGLRTPQPATTSRTASVDIHAHRSIDRNGLVMVNSVRRR